ncbi:MAG TPA: hypothetical protein VJ881_06315 [Halanaerobiales bacterium]|nr:hypothetical protein [Halanaerobiales bacterium]
MNIGIKKIAVFSIILAFSFLLVSCSFQEETKIGVMSMNQVLNESQRAQELQTELENFSNKEENFEVRKEELEEKLNNELNTVLGEISEEKELDIILYKDKSYYGGIDITSEVVEIIDEKYYEQNDGAENGE